MNAIFQTTVSHAFSWMKMYEFFIKIPLKFVPRGSINNIPALVQIMAWRRPGTKPLSEPMMFNWLTHICLTRPQWVNHDMPVVHHSQPMEWHNTGSFVPECHDDVLKWKHFPHYWPFVRGIYQSPVGSPHKGQSQSFDVFFDVWLMLVVWDAMVLIVASL